MRCNRNTRSLALMVAVMCFLAGPVQAKTYSQIIPSGKVKVYRDGKLTQELTEAAPLPKGAVLNSEGNSRIRLDNLNLVAKDGAKFTVLDEAATTRLDINSGTLYFAAGESTGPMVFETPSGVIETQQITFQANSSTPGLLKGFVEVSGETVKMGVMDGGSMVVSTPDGVLSIDSGKQITLSKDDSKEPAAGEPPSQAQQGTPQNPVQSSERIPAEYLAAGVLALFIGATVLLSNSQGEDNPPPASPATP